MTRYLLPLGIFGVLVALLFVGLHLDPREVPSPLIDKPAPAFSLPQLHEPNKTLSRQDLLGKVYLLNVWASWCAACRDEHPHLLALARTKQLPILGLNYKDTRREGSAWLKNFGDPYDASLYDGDGRIGIEFGVYGVPETFIIDKQGFVRFKHIGPVTPEVIDKRIVPMVRQLNG